MKIHENVLCEESDWEQFLEEVPLYPNVISMKGPHFDTFYSRISDKIIYKMIIMDDMDGFYKLSKNNFKIRKYNCFSRIYDGRQIHHLKTKLFAPVTMENLL